MFRRRALRRSMDRIGADSSRRPGSPSARRSISQPTGPERPFRPVHMREAPGHGQLALVQCHIAHHTAETSEEQAFARRLPAVTVPAHYSSGDRTGCKQFPRVASSHRVHVSGLDRGCQILSRPLLCPIRPVWIPGVPFTRFAPCQGSPVASTLPSRPRAKSYTAGANASVPVSPAIVTVNSTGTPLPVTATPGRVEQSSRLP